MEPWSRMRVQLGEPVCSRISPHREPRRMRAFFRRVTPKRLQRTWRLCSGKRGLWELHRMSHGKIFARHGPRWMAHFPNCTSDGGARSDPCRPEPSGAFARDGTACAAHDAKRCQHGSGPCPGGSARAADCDGDRCEAQPRERGRPVRNSRRCGGLTRMRISRLPRPGRLPGR